MSEIVEIKEYLNKIKKVVNFEEVFNIAGYVFIKKNRIDDLLCCLYASLPESYKRYLKDNAIIKEKTFSSAVCYDILAKRFASRFFLNKNLCVLYLDEVNRLLDTVISFIEQDIALIERKYNK